MLRLLLQGLLNLALLGIVFIFAVMGWAMLPTAWQEFQESRASRHWGPTPAVIVNAELHRSGRNWCVRVAYDYRIGAASYRGERERYGSMCSRSRARAQSRVDAIGVGSHVNAYVDPRDPARAVLHRGPGLGTWALVVAVPLMLLLVPVFLVLMVVLNRAYWRGLLAQRDSILAERAALAAVREYGDGRVAARAAADDTAPVSSPPAAGGAPETVVDRAEARFGGWILVGLAMLVVGSCAGLHHYQRTAQAEKRAREQQQIEAMIESINREAMQRRAAREAAAADAGE